MRELGAKPPTRGAQLTFTMKAAGLRIKRHGQNLINWPTKLLPLTHEQFPYILAEVRTPLYSEKSNSERALEIGKIQNLRVAARKLDNFIIPSGVTFSFWQCVGKCTKRKGYVQGRQLQEGCLIAAIGGGLCQLSNSLYLAALKAKFEILERHPHTMVIPGSAAEQGLDATVAWNYIDLRFRAKQEVALSIRLTQDELIVKFSAARPSGRSLTLLPISDGRSALDVERHSCATCEQVECFREGKSAGMRDSTAFIVDEWWDEFTPFLSEFKEPQLLAPLDGYRFKRPAYRFPNNQFSVRRYATLPTLLRAASQRGLPSQGHQLQRTLLANAEYLASSLADKIEYQSTHLVVSISLLPFLYRLGILGGRTYDVLMTRDSMANVQSSLDQAAWLHPDRSLLSDFRADPRLVQDEEDALCAARRLVTPHAGIASSWSNSYLLDWHLPSPVNYTPGRSIAFPGPTVARKGAYELREVAKLLDLEVVLLGTELEGSVFWEGVKTRRANRSANWLNGIGAVVQPAVVEHRPRALLSAIAAGCPVVATKACGLGSVQGWQCIEQGDLRGLESALGSILQDR